MKKFKLGDIVYAELNKYVSDYGKRDAYFKIGDSFGSKIRATKDPSTGINENSCKLVQKASMDDNTNTVVTRTISEMNLFKHLLILNGYYVGKEESGTFIHVYNNSKDTHIGNFAPEYKLVTANDFHTTRGWSNGYNKFITEVEEVVEDVEDDEIKLITFDI